MLALKSDFFLELLLQGNAWGLGKAHHARPPRLGSVLSLRPFPPHGPLLAFLRTDALPTDDRPTAWQRTPTDHPPAHQPRGDDGAGRGGCPLLRSPLGTTVPAAEISPAETPCTGWVLSAAEGTQVLAHPMAMPVGTWPHVGAEP